MNTARFTSEASMNGKVLDDCTLVWCCEAKLHFIGQQASRVLESDTLARSDHQEKARTSRCPLLSSSNRMKKI